MSTARPTRQLSYAEAVREAFDLMLAKDPRVLVAGLGVPDPKGFFGTTLGLVEKYGNERVMDIPCAENGLSGIMLGAALNGLRPVLNHQRVDFALLAMDPVCAQAANWQYMFNGANRVPLVIRMLIGRGWGQGPQHSQSLQSWFAHVPGLKVVMPTTPADAKGLLIASIEDDNPVVVLEHRWLHSIKGPVPEGHYATPIGPLRVARHGKDITIAAFSYMVLEALQAAETLQRQGIDAEVLDIRCLRPLDAEGLLSSVAKTRRLLVADHAWPQAGMAAELLALVAEKAWGILLSPPARVCFPDHPVPTSPALAGAYYPTAGHLVAAAKRQLGLPEDPADFAVPEGAELDKPNPQFTGPF